MSNHRVYSAARQDWPILCLSPQRAQIRDADCEQEDTQALAGNYMLLRDGMVVAPEDKALHPRTAVATNSSGSKL